MVFIIYKQDSNYFSHHYRMNSIKFENTAISERLKPTYINFYKSTWQNENLNSRKSYMHLYSFSSI